MRESAIQRDIRLYLGQQPDIVVWRNNVGVAVVGDSNGRRRAARVVYGLCTGSSDLICILAPRGRFCAFEVKAAKGRVSKEQALFIDLVRRMGGYAAVVRSVEDAMVALEEARRG